MTAGRWQVSIDGGRQLADGRPLFGSSKTLRGFSAGIVAGTLVAPLVGHAYITGCVFGALAMLGDLASSFIKRRLGYRAGCALPLLDQLPETALPLVLLQPVLGATALEMLVIVAVFTLIDLLASRVIKPDQPVCR